MSENYFLTVARFVSGLRFEIRLAMITSSYGVEFFEDTFGFTLKINLTFKEVVSDKT